ncbi:MAG TPA: response regulator [Leptolyngbyaceae cyanobacterium]
MNSSQDRFSIANILLVDDRPENLRVLYTILKKQGYQPRGVVSGQMALSSAKINPPDLILLDIMMPGMDGYEVCRCLKEDENTREIPVIFISAKGETFDKIKAFSVGGVDYITKPFEVEELIARIENHLTLYRLQKQLQEKNWLLEKEVRNRMLIEAALSKSNQELSRSNEELEQFAYIASHDLLAPLASITIYAQLLEGRYQEKLDEQGKNFIIKIVKGCHRMQTLINDLLEYSRLGNQENSLELTECNLIFEEACTNLQAAIRNNQAVVTRSDLPILKADGFQLLQLFQNLLSNAIKYRREEPPIIHISALLKEDSYLFSVRDNGIGIESQYTNQIFQLFKRLHSTKKYPGTGIGLAICQKIVEYHGGSIWVESEYGKGSIFYFTIKKYS